MTCEISHMFYAILQYETEIIKAPFQKISIKKLLFVFDALNHLFHIVIIQRNIRSDAGYDRMREFLCCIF